MDRAVVLLVIALVPTLVHAAEDEARERFEAGVVHVERGEFEAAFSAFERSIELRARPRVFYNLGIVAHRLGRKARAVSALTTFLESTSDRSPMVDHARTVLFELQPERGLVTIVVSGAPEVVELDGVALPIKGERTAVLVPAGDHRVVARRTGFEDVVHSFDIRARADVTVVLNQAAVLTTTRIQIDAQPNDATIAIDGRIVGRGRYAGPIEPGARRIEVTAPEHQPWMQSVRVESGTSPRLMATLERSSVPLTSKWWFWAVVGAVAVGAGVGAYVVARSERAPEGGSSGKVLTGLVRW